MGDGAGGEAGCGRNVVAGLAAAGGVDFARGASSCSFLRLSAAGSMAAGGNLVFSDTTDAHDLGLDGCEEALCGAREGCFSACVMVMLMRSSPTCAMVE